MSGWASANVMACADGQGTSLKKVDVPSSEKKLNFKLSKTGFSHLYTERHSRYSCTASRTSSVSVHGLHCGARCGCTARARRMQVANVNFAKNEVQLFRRKLNFNFSKLALVICTRSATCGISILQAARALSVSTLWNRVRAGSAW